MCLKSAHAAAAALACLVFAAPASALNLELSRLVGADQLDRRADVGPSAWADIVQRDHARRQAALQMLREGRLTEAVDFENAAILFQHGESPESFRLAHAMATIAAAMEPDRPTARGLKRISWDRLLQSMGRLQWYGSQSSQDPATGRYRKDPVDPTVTDAQRALIDEDPLALPPARP